MTVVFACMATRGLALVFNDCNDGSKLYIDGIEGMDNDMSSCSYGIEWSRFANFQPLLPHFFESRLPECFWVP